MSENLQLVSTEETALVVIEPEYIEVEYNGPARVCVGEEVRDVYWILTREELEGYAKEIDSQLVRFNDIKSEIESLKASAKSYTEAQQSVLHRIHDISHVRREGKEKRPTQCEVWYDYARKVREVISPFGEVVAVRQLDKSELQGRLF